MLLEQLATLSAVSGDEYKVRDFIKAQLTEMDIEFEIDKLGNVIAHNQGEGDCGVLYTHMDEVGFMVTGIELDGFLRMQAVGEVDGRYVTSKAVQIGEQGINGVIGSKAIHKKERNEMGKALALEDHYIDIGACDKDDAMKYVSLGDYISFSSTYVAFGKSQIKMKAADSRANIAILLELLSLKLNRKFDVVFTVLEKLEVMGLDEIGSIGAKTAIKRLKPSFTVALGGVPCSDLPEVKPAERVSELGKGPVLMLMDQNAIYDKEKVNVLRALATEKKIDVQMSKRADLRGFGHVNGINVSVDSSVSIGLPVRYMDTPISVIDKKDVKGMLELLKALVIEGEYNE